MPDLSVELEEALGRAVIELLEDAGIDRPPVNAITLAEFMGISVRLNKEQTSRGRILHRGNQTVITVQQEPRRERSQWTVAHEIGEHWLAREDGPWHNAETQFDAGLRETLANRFANLLLVPTHWLQFDARMARYDLLTLKEIYQTASHEVLAMRLLDLDPPTIISIFDNGNLSRRRSNLPYRTPPLQPLEREAQQLATDTGDPVFTSGEGVSVQAWPIHENDWKREILRTVLDDMF